LSSSVVLANARTSTAGAPAPEALSDGRAVGTPPREVPDRALAGASGMTGVGEGKDLPIGPVWASMEAPLRSGLY